MANRQVFGKQQVAHLWAHKAQDSARTPTGNFYFTGATLYSYGSHFVCGHLMPEAYNVESNPLVLINDSNYSTTTQRHMSAMRQAIPRYYAEFEVNGLNEGAVRRIGCDGAGAVVSAMLDSMCDSLEDAATTEHVRHATREASLATAARHAQMARHLATVDASRKDIPKELRAKARAVLRSIPSAADFVIDGSAREAIIAINKRVNRDKARATYNEKIARFRNKAGRVAEYVAADTHENANSYWLCECRDSINLFDHYVKRDADIGDIRISKSDTALRQTMGAAVEILENRVATHARNYNLNQWAESVAAMDADWTNLRAAESFLSTMVTQAEKLAAMDSAAEKTDRLAILARLSDRVNAYKGATAGERFRDTVATARSYMPGGHYLDALRYVGHAATIAEQANEPEKKELAVELVLLKSEIDAAMAERRDISIAEWRNLRRESIAREYCHDGALLRVRGDRIETSWSASVPLSVAPLVWRMVKSAHQNGAERTWAHGDGPLLGHYRINAIKSNGDIVVGCHEIKYGELARMAESLGYSNAIEAMEATS